MKFPELLTSEILLAFYKVFVSVIACEGAFQSVNDKEVL